MLGAYKCPGVAKGRKQKRLDRGKGQLTEALLTLSLSFSQWRLHYCFQQYQITMKIILKLCDEGMKH